MDEQTEEKVSELWSFWRAIQNPDNQISSMRLYVESLEEALELIETLCEHEEQHQKDFMKLYDLIHHELLLQGAPTAGPGRRYIVEALCEAEQSTLFGKEVMPSAGSPRRRKVDP
jgi:hypothetical protein